MQSRSVLSAYVGCLDCELRNAIPYHKVISLSLLFLFYLFLVPSIYVSIYYCVYLCVFSCFFFLSLSISFSFPRSL